MFNGAQVDSKLKEQTEVQVGCKLGKNMFSQEKKNSASKSVTVHASSGFPFIRAKSRKRIITSHKAIDYILCD